MLTNLPIIYPITDRRITGLSHVEQARLLFDGGARLVQLREKEASTRKFFDAVLETVELAAAYGASVIINDRADIALATNAAGLHLGQDDMPPDKARSLLGDQAVIGYSTHTVEQAIVAAQFPIDYVAIGPIFSTLTKVDPDAVVGLDGLRRVRDAIGEMPLVAIGGIGDDDISDVLGAGADSVAMISAILSSDDISRRIRTLILGNRRKCQTLLKNYKN
ncbi:MAG: thiamine phosphate synthase [Pyrinomonadaceae bacterium]